MSDIGYNIKVNYSRSIEPFRAEAIEYPSNPDQQLQIYFKNHSGFDTNLAEYEYSLDNITWNEFTRTSSTIGEVNSITVNFYDKIYLRAKSSSDFYNQTRHNMTFYIYGTQSYVLFKLAGNLNCLNDYEGKVDVTYTGNKAYGVAYPGGLFQDLFCFPPKNGGAIRSIKDIQLPNNFVTVNMFYNTFAGQYYLRDCFSLPRGPLVASCYQSMFDYCPSLAQIPSVSWNTNYTNYNVGEACANMFRGCRNIEISPTQTETCIYKYRIGENGINPSLGTEVTTTYGGMFDNTKNYTSEYMTPTANTIYYTSNKVK